MIDVTQDRGSYIGASDAYKLVRGDWLALYNEKKGITQPEDLSGVFRVQLGIHTEKFHLDWLRDQQGYDIRSDNAEAFIRTDGGFPLRAHPDAVSFNDAGTAAYPVEVKHTNGFADLNSMLQSYAAQLHLHMYAMQTDRCLFSFIAGNSDPEAHWIDADPDYTENLIKMCAAFWWHIEADEPPIEGDALTIDEPSLTVDDLKPYNMEEENCSNQWANFAFDYTETKGAAATFETAKKELKKLVPADASQAEGNGVLIRRSKSGSLLFK